MQVHGDDVVGAGHRQHVGHQLGADGSSDGNKKCFKTFKTRLSYRLVSLQLHKVLRELNVIFYDMKSHKVTKSSVYQRCHSFKKFQ